MISIKELQKLLDDTRREKHELQMAQTLSRLGGRTYEVKGMFKCAKSDELVSATVVTADRSDWRTHESLEVRINNLYREISRLEAELRERTKTVVPRPMLRWADVENEVIELFWFVGALVTE